MLAFGGGSARAVGLGSIELASDLNERLDASIPVLDLEGHPLDSVTVGLASPQHFRAVGIPYRPEFGQFRFELERTAAGGYRIRVRSPRPIVEPFVSFVLELKLPTGRLLREYTVLLDPPSAVAESLASRGSVDAPPDGSQASIAGDDTGLSSADTGDTGSADVAATGETDTASQPAGDSAADRYGPVRPGSSAWKIAADIRQPGTSIHQRMIALLRANPDAFRDNDLGKLKAGVWLDIPSAETVAAIPREQAAALYQQHVDPSDNAATGEMDRANKGDDGSKPYNLWVAHASAADAAETPPTAFDASEGEEPASGSPQAVVFRDVNPWTITFDDPFGSDATAATLVARIEQEFENSLASRDARFAELREGLATVQEELVTVREELALLGTRQQSRPAAASGVSGWMAGLAALLVFALGAIGGFWGGRRLTMRRLADDVAHGTGRPLADGQRTDPAPRSDSLDDPSAGSATDEANTSESDTDSHAAQQALPMTDAPLLGRADDSRVSRGSENSKAETAKILFQEADTDQVSDFYHSLAKLYLASGWPSDAEALLRSTIEQKGDKAIYRVRILEALYQLGHRDQFLRDFEAYQAIADANDPSWTWVQTMGRILWPDNPAFAAEGENIPAENTDDGYYELEQATIDALGMEEEEIVFDLADEEVEEEGIKDEGMEDEWLEGEVTEDEWLEKEGIGEEWFESEDILDFGETGGQNDDGPSLDVPESGDQDFPPLKSVDDPSLSDAPDDTASGSSGGGPSEAEEDEQAGDQRSVGGVNSGRSR